MGCIEDPTSASSKCYGSVSNLKQLYRDEENSVIRLGPVLNKKVLYPTLVERQNVNLFAKLFDGNNIAALKNIDEKNVLLHLKTPYHF